VDEEEDHDIPTLKIGQDKEDEQVAFVKKVKAKRNKDKLGSALRRIRDDAKADKNLMPAIIEAVKAYASVGEICDVFREVYGVYRDPANY
jgi:methylmalonyl-CoA mutase N-terminal domain/subunit